MHRFVAQNGLEEIFNSTPDESFQRSNLRDEIESSTASVTALTRTLLEATKEQHAMGAAIETSLDGVSALTREVAAYTGRSVSTRDRMWGALGTQCEKLSASLARSLSTEYSAAYSEGRRELHCEAIEASVRALDEDYGERVDVDLESALALPDAVSARGGLTQDALATHAAIQKRAAAGSQIPGVETNDDDMRRRMRRAAGRSAAVVNVDVPGGALVRPARPLSRGDDGLEWAAHAPPIGSPAPAAPLDGLDALAECETEPSSFTSLRSSMSPSPELRDGRRDGP